MKNHERNVFSNAIFEYIEKTNDEEIKFIFKDIVLSLDKFIKFDSSTCMPLVNFIEDLIKKMVLSSTSEKIIDFKRTLFIISNNLLIATKYDDDFYKNESFFNLLKEKIRLEVRLAELKNIEKNLSKKDFSSFENNTNEIDFIESELLLLRNLLKKSTYYSFEEKKIKKVSSDAENSGRNKERICKRLSRPDRRELPNYNSKDSDDQEIGEVNFSVITPNIFYPGEANELYFIFYEKAFELFFEGVLATINYDPIVYHEKLSIKKGIYRIVMTTSFDNHKEEEIINWQGRYKKCSFLLDVPEDYEDDEITVYFDLYDNNDIRLLNFKCAIRIGTNMHPLLYKHKIKRVFLSYSRKDLRDVLRIRQGMEALGNGNDIFLDIIDLKENSDWEFEIKKQIDNSDVFFLIWSKNSALKKSNDEMTGVENEYEYALERIKNNKNLSLIIINIDDIEVPKKLLDAQKQSKEISMIKAYISYSKKTKLDINEIDYILLGMKSLCIANGINFKVINYKQKSNLEKIDSCDIFYLMLSNSSSNDINVESEYKYALEYRGIDFIYTIPLEKVENINLPKLLKQKHLNSTIVYIIDGLKK